MGVRTMLGHGKLINLKLTDRGLLAEIVIEGMTPAMAEAVIELGRVELSAIDRAPAMPGADRAMELIAAAQAATADESP